MKAIGDREQVESCYTDLMKCIRAECDGGQGSLGV